MRYWARVFPVKGKKKSGKDIDEMDVKTDDTTTLESLMTYGQVFLSSNLTKASLKLLLNTYTGPIIQRYTLQPSVIKLRQAIYSCHTTRSSINPHLKGKMELLTSRVSRFYPCRRPIVQASSYFFLCCCPPLLTFVASYCLVP